MKIKFLFLTALFFTIGSSVFAQSNALTFKRYGVKTENLKNVRVNLKSHKNANTYRTNLRNAAKEKVNFAGHFIFTTWGCGTNCSESAIIDARNGAVFFPNELQGTVQGFCDLPENVNPSDAPEMGDEYAPVIYKADSRLLVLKGFSGGDFNDQKSRCGTYYLEWTGKNFKRVDFVAGKHTATP